MLNGPDGPAAPSSGRRRRPSTGRSAGTPTRRPLRDRPARQDPRRAGTQVRAGHIFLPHPPYVFLEDGTVDPDAATFASQLTFANSFLKRFLEPLLALPEEERPIIILQADEGPYPRRVAPDVVGFDWATVTDKELITKFGILDAWLMPGPEGEAPLPQDRTAVNTYPELFRRYFGADVPDAPDRISCHPRTSPTT